MKLLFDDTKKLFNIRLNPFGTYYGPQYYHPTWGNRMGFEAAVITGESYHSSAPSYNGYRQDFSLMISSFVGDELPSYTKNDLIAFANPPIVVTGGRIKTIEGVTREESPEAPKDIIWASDGKDDYILWEVATGDPNGYRVHLNDKIGDYNQVFDTEDTILVISDLTPGKEYYVSVTALFNDGTELGPEEEISFIAGESTKAGGIELPIMLQLKILWSGIMALID